MQGVTSTPYASPDPLRFLSRVTWIGSRAEVYVYGRETTRALHVGNYAVLLFHSYHIIRSSFSLVPSFEAAIVHLS